MAFGLFRRVYDIVESDKRELKIKRKKRQYIERLIKAGERPNTTES